MRSSKAAGVSCSSRRALRFVPAAATSACSGPRRQARRERGDGPAIGDVEVVGDDVAPDRGLLDELGAARRRVDVRAGVGEGQRGGEADPLEAPVTSAVRPSSAAMLTPPGRRRRGRP